MSRGTRLHEACKFSKLGTVCVVGRTDVLCINVNVTESSENYDLYFRCSVSGY